VPTGVRGYRHLLYHEQSTQHTHTRHIHSSAADGEFHAVQARRNTEAAAVEARKAMLAGGQAHIAPARAAGQADAVAASQGITKSLLRTRQLMAQVGRSSLA
jgi:hypothetical protein